jgi:hypothetical protein
VTSPASVPAESRLQEFVAVQPYRFEPAGALVLKNVSPTPQVAGSAVPDLKGFVVLAPEKSTLLLWVRKSTIVCALATPTMLAKTTNARCFRMSRCPPPKKFMTQV